MSSSLPATLPEGYYLENFEYLLDFVGATYPHLLTAPDKAFISSFFRQGPDARKLFVRLSNRKGPYFRADRLDYPEIDLGSAIPALEQAGLLRQVTPGIDEAARLMTREELREASVDAPRSASKACLLEHCLASNVNPAEVLGLKVLEPLCQSELAVVRLLFFGNARQDMTEFVLHEIVAPFEQYSLSGDACPFPDRETVDRLVLLQQFSDISREMIEVDESGGLLLELADLVGSRPEAGILARKYDRIVNRLARQLERLGLLQEALTLYSRTGACPSRERRARLHEKLGSPGESAAICREIIAGPVDDDELMFARSFGARIAKRHNLDWQHGQDAGIEAIPQSAIVLAACEHGVEGAAVQHFTAAGFDARYVENTLLRGLFGLAFWDVIFAPVPGAFFNPFQRAPLDINTPDFYANRQQRIRQRFSDIRAGGLPGIVLRNFDEKQGIANLFVNWSALDEGLVSKALASIPLDHFAAIFSRLVRDPKNNGSGFPDLVLFSNNRYRLVEIKGPGDKLQKNQVRWFHYFQDQGIPAEVVNVEYAS